MQLLVPVGTVAFALTFLATDVVGEVFDRKHAIYIVWAGVVLLVFILLYFIATVGDTKGNFWIFNSPGFWNTEQQESYSFVFSGTFWIYIGGFIAVLVSSINDVYIFHHFKEKHSGKNLFWFRNNVSTVLSQIINSTLFVSIAFATVLTIPEILSAIAGQVIFKVILAFLDTPLAYAMRNYANEVKYWYNPLSAGSWKG
jgi:uncharacterized integral membrane protein (TIGR00697 family)